MSPYTFCDVDESSWRRREGQADRTNVGSLAMWAHDQQTVRVLVHKPFRSSGRKGKRSKETAGLRLFFLSNVTILVLQLSISFIRRATGERSCTKIPLRLLRRASQPCDVIKTNSNLSNGSSVQPGLIVLGVPCRCETAPPLHR